MPLTCIAIDDEPIALGIIENFCERAGGVSLKTFTNPAKGLAEAVATRPDLLLLDIKMGHTNGMTLARKIPQGVKIAFTTAYSEFAADAFEIDAIDYLCKPFTFDRFAKCLKKAISLKRVEIPNVGLPEGSLCLRADYRKRIIPLREINYIESLASYVRIHLGNGETVESQIPLKTVESMLPEGKFMRIHKSFVIPAWRIKKFDRKEITLVDSTLLPVGRAYTADVKSSLSGKIADSPDLD